MPSPGYIAIIIWLKTTALNPNNLRMANEILLDETWKKVLINEFHKPYFLSLMEFLHSEKQGIDPIFPPENKIFASLNSTPFNKVRIVILGQDPYHGPGQANGMCFSVDNGVALPPSLKNIFKELNADIGIGLPQNGDLSPWAEQGVLLLNSVLTVRSNQPASHQNKGWEIFTDTIIQTLSEHKEHLVFILWGAFARSKKNLVDKASHLILEAAHPSPLSAHSGFLGCKHFSKANDYLREHRIKPIDWNLGS